MFKKSIVIIATVASLLGCGQKETVVVQQAPVPVVQPVYVNNPDPMTGVIAGMAIGAMMSNGMRYDGHNGYNDSRYRGPSKTIVVNNVTNKTVINNGSPSTPSAPSNTANAASAGTPKPVSTSPTPSSSPVKVKNPGDFQAIQTQKNDALKADLKAKQVARAASPVKNGGFNKMSKSTKRK